MAKIVLELRHIGMDFGAQRVLKDISLNVHEQEIVSIIGPNGAGKTTLFDIISGRIRPTRGAVLFGGCDITDWPPHRICRQGIGRTFQIARPFPEMTTIENVLVGIWFGKNPEHDPHQPRRATDRAFRLLELTGLSHKAYTLARQLTLSERRRLEVARALATQPSLLLLDEIAAGLSPQAINLAVELIQNLRSRGLTLLIIDHFLNLTARVSDRLIAIDRGEAVASGAPFEVIEHPEVISAYLGERHLDNGEEVE